MKKVLVLAGAVAVAVFGFVACDDPKTATAVLDGAAQGISEGLGYEYVGEADSKSDCQSMVKEAGYTYADYKSNGSCYGRN